MNLLHEILSEVYKLVEIEVPKLIDRIVEARGRAKGLRNYAVRIRGGRIEGRVVAVDSGYSKMRYRVVTVAIVSLAKVVEEGGVRAGLTVKPLLLNNRRGVDTALIYYSRLLELEAVLKDDASLALLDGPLSFPEPQRQLDVDENLLENYRELHEKVVGGRTPLVAVAKDLNVNAYASALDESPLADWLKEVAAYVHEQLAISWILSRWEYLPPVEIARGIYATYVNLGGGLPLYVELNEEARRRVDEVLATLASLSPTGYPMPLALADRITRVTRSLTDTVQSLVERGIAKFVPKEYAWLFAKGVRVQHLY